MAQDRYQWGADSAPTKQEMVNVVHEFLLNELQNQDLQEVQDTETGKRWRVMVEVRLVPVEFLHGVPARSAKEPRTLPRL
jgi:hypothetical protein